MIKSHYIIQYFEYNYTKLHKIMNGIHEYNIRDPGLMAFYSIRHTCKLHAAYLPNGECYLPCICNTSCHITPLLKTTPPVPCICIAPDTYKVPYPLGHKNHISFWRHKFGMYIKVSCAVAIDLIRSLTCTLSAAVQITCSFQLGSCL